MIRDQGVRSLDLVPADHVGEPVTTRYDPRGSCRHRVSASWPINDIEDFRAIWQFPGWIDDSKPLGELADALEDRMAGPAWYSGAVIAYPMIHAATMKPFQTCHLHWAGPLPPAPARSITQAVQPMLAATSTTATAMAQPLMCPV
jgi:hypothetical protein